MNKNEVEKYVNWSYEDQIEEIWKDLIEEGWINEDGELVLGSLSEENGFSEDEIRDDLYDVLGKFWRRYDIVFDDKILDMDDKL
jgi:hypothetical protein